MARRLPLPSLLLNLTAIACALVALAAGPELSSAATSPAQPGGVRGGQDYSTVCDVQAFVFFLHVNCSTGSNGPVRAFCGRAGGLFTAVIGQTIGNLHATQSRIFQATRSFEFNAYTFYFNINFFGRRHHVLGHFNGAGGVPLVGVGGGSGKWYPNDC